MQSQKNNILEAESSIPESKMNIVMSPHTENKAEKVRGINETDKLVGIEKINRAGKGITSVKEVKSNEIDKEGKKDNLKRKKGNSPLSIGIIVSMIAGMCYGIYSAFVTVAMNRGIWLEWKGPDSMLTKFAAVYIVGALGAALNDSISGLWAWIAILRKGKAVKFIECLRTREGKILIIAAIAGGPVAGTAYITAIQLAGSVVIPVASLTTVSGAILGRIILKQKLNARKIFGIILCVFAGILIGTSSAKGTTGNNVAVGFLLAFMAAFSWGLEGVIAGYSTTFIDYEIGITVRQTVSGIFNFFILLPLISLIGGNATMAWNMGIQALWDIKSLIFFVISGFFSLYAFSLWYKGNSICGAALGNACNASSFWGPFFCWIIIGVIMGEKGWTVAPVVWIGAAIIITGISFIALNPMEMVKKLRK